MELRTAAVRPVGGGGIACRTAAGFVALVSSDGAHLIDEIATLQTEPTMVEQLSARIRDDQPAAFVLLFTAGGDPWLMAWGSCSAAIAAPAMRFTIAPVPDEVLVHQLPVDNANEIVLGIPDVDDVPDGPINLTEGSMQAGTVAVIFSADDQEPAPSSAEPSPTATPPLPEPGVAEPSVADNNEDDDADNNEDDDADNNEDDAVDDAEMVAAAPLAPIELTFGDAPAFDAVSEATPDLSSDESDPTKIASDDSEPVTPEMPVSTATPPPPAPGTPALDVPWTPPPRPPEPPQPISIEEIAPSEGLPAVVPVDGPPADMVIVAGQPAAQGIVFAEDLEEISDLLPELPISEGITSIRIDAAPEIGDAPEIDTAAETDVARDEPLAFLRAVNSPDITSSSVSTPVEPSIELAPADTHVAAPLGPTLVLGITCPNGHHNHPEARVCTTCGVSIGNDDTAVLLNGPRPALGVLMADDGSTWSIESDVIIGREPTSHPEVRAGSAQPATMTDETLSMSRQHARLCVDEWTVRLGDLESSNGTWLQRGSEGDDWMQVPSDSMAEIRSGDRIRIGGRTLQVELHHAP